MPFFVPDLLIYQAPRYSLLKRLINARAPLFVDFSTENKLYNSLRHGRNESITVLEVDGKECSTSPLGSHEVRVLGMMEKENQRIGFGHQCREIFYLEEVGDIPVYEVLLIRGHGPVCEEDGRKRRKYRQLVLREHTSGCSERGQGWPPPFSGYGPAK